MTRASKANKAMDSYHQQIGWGTRELTIEVEGIPRRLDIGDEILRMGIEHKTGKMFNTQSNQWEALRDSILVEQGWHIEWVFEGTASKPLLNNLESLGIKYKFINTGN